MSGFTRRAKLPSHGYPTPDSLKIDASETNDDASNVSEIVKGRHYLHPVYALPRNDAELKRLDNQHYLLKKVFGSNIISPVTWKESDKIVDSGTGTATWLQDVASEVPKCVTQFVGFDIEDHLFPAQERLPKNIELYVYSVLSRPEEWTNTFTLVRQRFLTAGLRRTEWPQAIKELYRTTKPGGWAELWELARWNTADNKERQEEARKMYENRGLMTDCARHLGSMMRDAGFTDICYVEKSAPIGTWGGEDGIMHSENMLGAMKESMDWMRKAGACTEDEIDVWVKRVEEDHREREGRVEWAACYGMKPDCLA